MACDCIEKMEADIQEATGDPEAFVKSAYDIKQKMRRFDAEAYYRGKILGLTFKKNFSLAYLAFDYCPVCGKKYIEEADNG